MKDIKFRAKKNNKYGDWVYGGGILTIDKKSIMLSSDKNGRSSIYFIVYETIGQYIGRKDANDNFIFSTDIVNVYDNSMEYFPNEDNGGENFIIKWWDEMCGFGLWNIQTKDWWKGDINPFSYLSQDEIKIIGNVIDNSELIKRD